MLEKISIGLLIRIDWVKKVDYSDWAAPILVVSKPNEKVRICGNFKALNCCIKVDQHSIPILDP